MDIETINATRERGFRNENFSIEIRRNEAMRFIWIPGERPVKVPAITPTISAMVSSKSIVFLVLSYVLLV